MTSFIPELASAPCLSRQIKSTAGYELLLRQSGRLAILKAPRLTSTLIRRLAEDDVQSIAINGIYQEGAVNFNQLAGLPGLRHLRIVTGFDQDWRQLTELPGLFSLRLDTQGKPPQIIDFTQFRRLELCEITWHEHWASVLECAGLRHLSVRWMRQRADLDLRRLAKLRECFITQCLGLKRVILPRRSMLVSMRIAGCRRFREVLPSGEFRKLQFLWLNGRTDFNLPEISKLRDLRRLWLDSIGPITSVGFLKSCRKLEFLDLCGSTDVQNGDLRFLKLLPFLRSVAYNRQRRHYVLS